MKIDLKGVLKKNEKIVRWIVIILFVFLCCSTIFSSVKSYQLGRICNKFRERIVEAESSNKQLADTVGKCKSVCGELGESVDRNIRTSREAIELIEEIRTQVQSLEMVVGDFDWDKYYNYWDNVYSNE